jgi:hypothetical protein
MMGVSAADVQRYRKLTISAQDRGRFERALALLDAGIGIAPEEATWVEQQLARARSQWDASAAPAAGPGLSATTRHDDAAGARERAPTLLWRDGPSRDPVLGIDLETARLIEVPESDPFSTAVAALSQKVQTATVTLGTGRSSFLYRMDDRVAVRRSNRLLELPNDLANRAVEQKDIDWKSLDFLDRFGASRPTRLPDTDRFAQAVFARSVDVSTARATFGSTFFRMGERVAWQSGRDLLELPHELAMEALQHTDFEWETFTLFDRLAMSSPEPVPDADPLSNAILTRAKGVSTATISPPDDRSYTFWKMGERAGILRGGEPFELSRELAMEVLGRSDVVWKSFTFAERFDTGLLRHLPPGDSFREAIAVGSREVSRAEVTLPIGSFTFFKMGERVAMQSARGLLELPPQLAAEALEQSDISWRALP